MPEPYDDTAIQSISTGLVQRPGQVGHHHHGALEHADQQQVAGRRSRRRSAAASSASLAAIAFSVEQDLLEVVARGRWRPRMLLPVDEPVRPYAARRAACHTSRRRPTPPGRSTGPCPCQSVTSRSSASTCSAVRAPAATRPRERQPGAAPGCGPPPAARAVRRARARRPWSPCRPQLLVRGRRPAVERVGVGAQQLRRYAREPRRCPARAASSSSGSTSRRTRDPRVARGRRCAGRPRPAQRPATRGAHRRRAAERRAAGAGSGRATGGHPGQASAPRSRGPARAAPSRPGRRGCGRAAPRPRRVRAAAASARRSARRRAAASGPPAPPTSTATTSTGASPQAGERRRRPGGDAGRARPAARGRRSRRRPAAPARGPRTPPRRPAPAESAPPLQATSTRRRPGSAGRRSAAAYGAPGPARPAGAPRHARATLGRALARLRYRTGHFRDQAPCDPGTRRRVGELGRAWAGPRPRPRPG